MANFQVVIVDEAQDLTPCQASLFWGQPRRDQVVYLFGDPHQQLYRFRGASDTFHKLTRDESLRTTKFHLTGSFRFGKHIAKVASLVLKALGGEKLVGRGVEPGRVFAGEGAEEFERGTVICRTNKGTYEYLYLYKPAKWCFLSGAKCVIPKLPNWVYDLEEFLKHAPTGEEEDDEGDDEEDEGDKDGDEDAYAVSFVYKGEVFKSLKDVKNYLQEEDDPELLKFFQLLQFLVARSTSLDDFLNTIKKSFAPLKENETFDTYNGVILSTVHKAKGLEFERVLIYSDFRFKLIKSAVEDESQTVHGDLSQTVQGDEANLLYVALSRSKKDLYLCDEASSCLDALSKKFQEGDVQKHRSVSMLQERIEWEKKWKVFASTKPTITSLSQIPWPISCLENENGCGRLLALDSKMSVDEQRSYIRTVLLRYHPDKFLPRYSVCEHCFGEIKSRLEDIVNAVTCALEALHNPDGDNF